MGSVSFNSISGVFPVTIYVSDQFGNNQSLLGTLSTFSPTVEITLPGIFGSAPVIMITVIDANQCSTFKLLSCDLFTKVNGRITCGFSLQIDEVDCNYSLQVQDASCEFDTVVGEMQL